jgi:hypothetical protein
MNSDTVSQILTGLTAVSTIAYAVSNRNNHNTRRPHCHCYPRSYQQDHFQANNPFININPLNQQQSHSAWNQFSTNSFNQECNRDYNIERAYGIQDSECSLTGLIDPKDVLNTPKLTPAAYAQYVVNQVRQGTQVINNGIIHRDENIPYPNYLIEASRHLQNLRANPIIALEVQNTENNKKLVEEFMSNPQISSKKLIQDLFGGRPNDYTNDRIYGLVEAARSNRIPIALIDGNMKEIDKNFKKGDYSYSRDDAMFDNIKELTNNGYTVLTLLGLAHTTELTENRTPNRQEQSVLINPKRTLGSLLKDSSVRTANLALVSQNEKLSSSDLDRIENEDPTFMRNTKKLSLEFAGFDQAFRV